MSVWAPSGSKRRRGGGNLELGDLENTRQSHTNPTQGSNGQTMELGGHCGDGFGNCWTDFKDFHEVYACPFWSCIGCLGILGFLLLVILLPLSFSYIDYNQYAFKKDSVSNNVDTDTVYTRGRYYWGVGKEPIAFPALAQHVNFNAGPDDEGPLVVFTDAGLEFTIDASFQYFLLKDGLGELYNKFSKIFHSQIVNVARVALKNEAPKWSSDDYVNKREDVYHAMYNALKFSLDNLCGNVKCVDVPLNKFQLRRISFPAQITTKYLDVAVQTQRNIEESARQKADLIRKETEQLVEEFNANITIVTQTAHAQANRLKQEAEASSFRMKQLALGEGIGAVFQNLGIDSTDQESKAKFMRLMGVLDGMDPKLLFGLSNALVSV